jgi:DNA (cytosine-5)-methyltransferase 1
VRSVGSGATSRKLERLRAGAPPRVLDLFAGCGGLSLGFQAAGFQIAAAVEIDEPAACTHAVNFQSASPQEVLTAHALPKDITATEPEELTSSLTLGSPIDAFDVVVGGPPCQAYARVGRAKLREVADHPLAFKVDPRGNLYLR